MPRKTEFYLIPNKPEYRGSKITIIGKKPENRPYISVYAAGGHDLGTLNAADLERFAVNILKALNSKKLASHNNNYRHDPYPNAEGQGVQ